MTLVSPAMQRLAAEFQARTDRPADYVMSGMAPNAAHLAKLSYHNSARDNHFAYGEYSLHYPEDQAGGRAMPDYGAAWDLHWGPADMILVTKRLIASCEDPNDHRLDGVAEVAGTTNGTTVHAYYNNTKTDDPNNTGGWDSGHVTHNHLSLKRNVVNNYDAIKGIMDVICGVPLEGDDMTPEQEAKLDKALAGISALYKLFGIDENGDHKIDVTSNVQGAVTYGLRLSPEFQKLQADVAAIKTKTGA